MRLKAFTDVSLRILIQLAYTDQKSLTSREVAEATAIPYTHAAKAVAMLGSHGWIETKRGRGGGLRLTDAGRNVSVGTIVRMLEGTEDVAGCEGDTPCPLRHNCSLRHALAAAREAFMATLDPITIDTLTHTKNSPITLTLPTQPGT
ncbi:RrF2 family transcriptional regulator [Haloglycomyces albus]|uniref:RrF2 family transcriptional regulator n=1 Tax=Haloglycomyces albus TaxID=526067 RepID=UPI00046C9442|nr:Rrf2 family transcriptional regulator [Haloglycomyces albus]